MPSPADLDAGGGAKGGARGGAHSTSGPFGSNFAAMAQTCGVLGGVESRIIYHSVSRP